MKTIIIKFKLAFHSLYLFGPLAFGREGLKIIHIYMSNFVECILKKMWKLNYCKRYICNPKQWGKKQNGEFWVFLIRKENGKKLQFFMGPKRTCTTKPKEFPHKFKNFIPNLL